MIRTGTIILALSALAAALPASAQDVRENGTPHMPLPLIEPCASPASYALDFLVGHWSLTPYAGGAPIAKVTIEKTQANCELNERWPQIGARGRGVSLTHRRADDRWHGYWIDPDGAVVSLSGGMRDGALVLTGWWYGAGIETAARLTYSRDGEGRIRQKAEKSPDKGLGWSPISDLLYTRIP